MKLKINSQHYSLWTRLFFLIALLATTLLIVSPLCGKTGGRDAPAAAQTLPRPDHIVIVIEENKGYQDIINGGNAPYLKSLVKQGALLTSFYALHHPSQPNYMELFSGEDQGVYNDNCPAKRQSFSKPSLGGLLRKHSFTFIGYADALPPPASSWKQICNPPTNFAVKHCPWMDFKDVPVKAGLDFNDFPTDSAGFEQLPTVTFVIPDLVNDMHGVGNTPTSKEIADGDRWLREHLDAYAQWAKANKSLLIITWDEDGSQYKYPKFLSQKITTSPPQNQIATILVGSMVKPNATGDQTYTHYDLLRTIQDMYNLKPLLGNSDKAKDIIDIWQM